MEETATILVADDDPFICTIIEKTLVRAGYRVRIAHDGQEAFQITSMEKPDLLLVDLRMPYMTGIEVLTALRNEKIDVPVIILTAQDDIKTVVEALQAGANDFMSKPFEREELLARVKTHLTVREATRMKTLLAFAGATCHEMNQPLQVILGRLAMMKTGLGETTGNATPELKRHMNAIELAGNELVRLAQRIQEVDNYKTTTYVGNTEIVDLGKKSK